MLPGVVIELGAKDSADTPSVRVELDVLVVVKLEVVAAARESSVKLQLTQRIVRDPDVLPAEHLGLGVGLQRAGHIGDLKQDLITRLVANSVAEILLLT